PASMLLEFLPQRLDRREPFGLPGVEPKLLQVLQLVLRVADPFRQRISDPLGLPVLLEVLLRDLLRVLPRLQRDPLFARFGLDEQFRVTRLDLPQIRKDRLSPPAELLRILRDLVL